MTIECSKCGPAGKCLNHAKRVSELSLRMQGAWTFLELQKKAATAPDFAGFLQPAVFFKSLGWFQTKKKRGYTAEQVKEFEGGFAEAAQEAARG